MTDAYELMKVKLIEIAKIVGEFPETLHERVYDTLINELKNSNPSLSSSVGDASLTKNSETLSTSENVVDVKQSINSADSRSRNEKLFCFLKNHEEIISDLKDIEFACLVAYYYEEEAEGGERRDEIDSEVLRTAFRLSNRKPPKNPKNALNNARNPKYGYMESGSSDGLFKLSLNGVYHVKNKILSKSTNDE